MARRHHPTTPWEGRWTISTFEPLPHWELAQFMARMRVDGGLAAEDGYRVYVYSQGIVIFPATRLPLPVRAVRSLMALRSRRAREHFAERPAFAVRFGDIEAAAFRARRPGNWSSRIFLRLRADVWPVPIELRGLQMQLVAIRLSQGGVPVTGL